MATDETCNGPGDGPEMWRCERVPSETIEIYGMSPDSKKRVYAVRVCSKCARWLRENGHMAWNWRTASAD